MKVAIISVLILVAAVLFGCSSPGITGDAPCNWRLSAGDPGLQAIVRTQDKTMVKCDDPKFAEYICLTHSDLKNLLECSSK